ncbi:ABC transporter substrate-binding protein [Candidatus Omnitrophota bacterium]
MRKTLGLLTVLLVVCIVAGCAQQAVERKEPIKIGVLVWPGYAHSYIAQEKGFFEENGVNVELLLSEGYIDVLNLYKDGDVDGIFTLLPDVVIMDSEGVSTKIVYIPDLTVTADGIVAKPEYNSLVDLRGKKIGIEGINSFAHVFALQVLEAEGLKEGDVYFENIPAMEILDALEEGRIEAGHTWVPVLTQAQEKGYKVLAYSSGILPAVIVDVLAFNSKIIRERPDGIQAIIKSLLEARDFIFSNKNEAIKIMAEANGMTEEEMVSGIDGIHFPDLEENKELLEKSEKDTSLYASGQIIAEFYLERGQLSRIPEFDKIIEPRFVNNMRRKNE